MRLGNFTAVELTRTVTEPINDARECRVVAYVAEQERPIYVSEARRPLVSGKNAIVKFNEFSFGDSPLRRSFRLALQLWINRDSWQLEDQWIIDLRHLRRRKAQNDDHIVLYTHDGPMVPAIPIQEEQPGLRKDNASSQSSSLDPKPLPHALSFRLFGWSASSDDESKTSVTQQEPGNLVSVSYPALVDLWTLQNSIDDARVASLAVSEEINELLPHSILPIKDKESVLMRKLTAIQKQTRIAREKAQEVRKLTTDKRGNDAAINNGLRHSTELAKSLAQQDVAAPKVKEEDPRIAKEQARLASQLLEIFPIDPIEDGKFHFTIRGLVLPSVFAINHYDPIQVGAALGFVAQVVVLLSQYLDVALPYPITVYGSQSFIADSISAIKHGSNKFPLWTRGALLYRVEYALYLLHKDIEQLMNAVNLAVADLKQTLANLKNLLLVISHR